MAVVEAKIQTVEDIYRLVWTAVANKRCLRAIYKELPRLFCPHRLGRNQAGQLRVLCYQFGGESESGLAPIGFDKRAFHSPDRSYHPVSFSWGLTLDMSADTGLNSFLSAQLADDSTHWSLGTFGAIAEVTRAADEPVP